jgi:hypothetical protein
VANTWFYLDSCPIVIDRFSVFKLVTKFKTTRKIS